MNCSNCNTPLTPGNPVCPNCGTTNDLSPEKQVNETGMQDLDDGEEAVVTQVDANIAPPTLDVNSEDLTKNVQDLGTGDLGSTYDPTFDPDAEAKRRPEIIEDVEGDGIPEYVSGDSVNIDIPSVSKPVDVSDVPSDGSIPSVDTATQTIGSVESDDVKQFKIGGKTIRIKMGKKRNVPSGILIGGVIIFFIIGIMVGSVVFKQNVCITGVNNMVTNTEDVHYVADGENNTTKAGRYTYKIPKGYVYDKLNGGVNVYDEKGTWRIFIRAVTGSYENMANAKVSIEASIKTEDINVVSIKETKINDKNHLIVETSDLQNRLMAFVDAKHDYVFFIEIVNADNTFNYELLNIADDIIDNAKYNQTESSIESISIKDIADLSANAAEAHKSLTK